MIEEKRNRFIIQILNKKEQNKNCFCMKTNAFFLFVTICEIQPYTKKLPLPSKKVLKIIVYRIYVYISPLRQREREGGDKC